jgi:hypothetical protein
LSRSRSIVAWLGLALAIGSGPITNAIGGTKTEVAAPTSIAMRHVDLRIDPRIVFHIETLRGQLLRAEPSRLPTFDDKHSLLISIDAAKLALSSANLADLLNDYVFAYPGAPITDVKIAFDHGTIALNAVVHKGIGIPVHMKGNMSVDADGTIRFGITAIRAADLPVKGLLDLLGVKVQGILALHRDRGVDIQGNDLLLDVNRIPIAPQIRGRVTAVRIAGDRLNLVFGRNTPTPPPLPVKADNFIYLRGGMVAFGKLTMRDADLEIVDIDPSGPFEFYIDRYNVQLVAGFVRNTPSYGLIVFMPDFSKALAKASAAPAQSRPKH